MEPQSFLNSPTAGLQLSADAAEGYAVERFLRWREFARAVQVAVRRGELSARLDIALRSTR
jgi:hypothetical protein